MSLKANVPYIDSILSPWKPVIADDYESYRNHVIRMSNFCLLLKDCDAEEQQKIEIAACFHDIGIWTQNTLDYLSPSIPPTRQYLKKNGLSHWEEEICLMIIEHHRIRSIKDYESPLIELFRKADLVDFSNGLVTFGLTKAVIAEVKKAFPTKGFHWMLVKKTGSWLLEHPLRPAPMMKW